MTSILRTWSTWSSGTETTTENQPSAGEFWVGVSGFGEGEQGEVSDRGRSLRVHPVAEL